MTLTGQVIDVYCKRPWALPARATEQCAEACAKAVSPRDPASDGTIYMPVGSKPGRPQNPRLLPFAEAR